MASLLMYASSCLRALADAVESVSLPSLPAIPSVNLSPPLFIVTTFLLMLSTVFLIPFILRSLTTPNLISIPAPSITYDPYTDTQSDDFLDEDVKPQLCKPGQGLLECVNPGSGTVIGYVKPHDVKDVERVIERSRIASVTMQEMSFAKRRLWLRVLSNYLLFNQNELCEVSCQDTGKTMLDASLGEILPTLEKCRWLLKEGEGTLKPSMRRTGPMMVHKSAYVEYIPLGVIVAISPWNYPLHNMFNPALAAIFSGNSIIIKPSEETLYSSLHYIRILRRALSLCGLPVDAVQIVLGGPEVGEKLVSSHVDKIFFTGSTKVGLSVAQSAAKKLTPLCLELGGKDAFAVCDDAEIGHAVNICLRGVFQNAGQNCIGVERVFVHEKVKERFVGMVVDVVKRMRCGVDTGAMTMCERGIAHVDELVQDAVSKGAKVLVGGKKAERAGFYYEPTVLDGVTGDMRIAQEEVFGPVLSLLSFSSDTQLVQMVNDCPFGLGSSIFTSSPRRASKIMSGLRVGMSNVNDFGTNYLCQSMPFGGTKMSGSDRFAGIEGLRGCCLMRSVTWNRWGFMKTRIPKGMKYPTGANCFELAREINDLMYGEGWFSKMDNLRNMVGMLIFGGWKPRTVGSG